MWPRCRCLDSSSSRTDGRSGARGRGCEQAGRGQPRTQLTHFIQRDDEGTLFLLEQVDGLKRLRLQAVHDVHHQDGDVAQRAASVPQVTEGKHINLSKKAVWFLDLIQPCLSESHLKDSCPGVSMISMPGIFRFSLSNCSNTNVSNGRMTNQGCRDVTEHTRVFVRS